MASYPIGYFTYKYQLRKGSVVNTCPLCEVKIIEKGIKNTNDESIRHRLEENYILFKTRKIVCARHKMNANKVYGINVR